MNCDFQRSIAKILTIIKGFFAVCGFISGVVVIAIQSAGSNSNIIGGLFITLALISAIDAFGMSLELKKFQKENDRLEASNKHFSQNNDRLDIEVRHFKSQNQSLTATAESLKVSNKQLKDQLSDFKIHLANLDSEIKTLQETKKSLISNNITYAQQNAEYRDRLLDLGTQNNNLRESVDLLSKTSQQVSDELQTFKEQNTTQARQIDSLRIVQQQSKQLIQALMTAGDDFKDFQSVLVDSIDKIQNTGDAMGVILEKLAGSKFSELDADGDGNISPEELVAWSQRH